MYKLVKEHPNTFEIKHPDGSSFHIAKTGISKSLVPKIKALGLADGGVVPEPDSNQAPLDISPATNEEVPAQPSNDLQVSPVSDQEAKDQGMPTPDVQRKPAQENAAISTENPSDILNQHKTYNEQYKQGLQTSSQAESEGLKNQANIYANQQKTMEDAMKLHQQKLADLDAEHKQLASDVVNAKIDPNRVWNNSSTGNKIGAAIGILLSGIGSGLTGSPNMAMGVIKDNIDKDIEAQKAELGKKENLLSQNLRKYGDLNTATHATMLQLGAITQGQIAAAAAKTGSQDVLAKAQMAGAKISDEMMLGTNELSMNLTKQQMQRKAMSGNMQGGQDPSTLVQYLVPKEHQANAFKEIERAQDTRKMSNSIVDSFNQAEKENTVLKTGAGWVRTPASVLALHQAMQPTFQDLEGTVRQAAMDNTFKNITPAPGDSEHTIETKRAALKNYLQSKSSAPFSKGFGIDLGKFSTTSSDRSMDLPEQQKQYVTWARQNPQDPRAQLVLKKLGVQ